ncbi:hypothetical protein MBAV_004178 [Candidatus Magnetobacterium bavaricum]|uniref:Uncharacterized protein n=1 Tax=Candidatus Magnetobacterium bavaricum TaxID=29290 RepID=A0A0F3GP25_9BACT|nr:hypothetical protein MBAV_004178 [Candidatus Magnetobacterium bavaricum]
MCPLHHVNIYNNIYFLCILFKKKGGGADWWCGGIRHPGHEEAPLDPFLLSCSRFQGLLFWGDFYVASTKIGKDQRAGIHQFPQCCFDFVFFYPLVGRYLFEDIGLFEFFLTG